MSFKICMSVSWFLCLNITFGQEMFTPEVSTADSTAASPAMAPSSISYQIPSYRPFWAICLRFPSYAARLQLRSLRCRPRPPLLFRSPRQQRPLQSRHRPRPPLRTQWVLSPCWLGSLAMAWALFGLQKDCSYKCAVWCARKIVRDCCLE